MKYQLHIILIFFLSVAIGCSKTETISGITMNDIYPLKTGKVYFYRLDSTVLANFNQNLVVHSYNAKDSVENEFTDNQGRKSFRIFRYLRDTLNTKSWTYTATYVATFDANRVEYIDNNLRFVVLTNLPKETTTWKGTQFINTISPSPFSYFYDWNFQYQNVGNSFNVRKGIIQDTYTVFQQDETLPDISFNPNNYQERSLSKEVYANGIGLIYKEFLRWVYQPPTAINKYYQEGSYGIKLSLIDYK